MITIDDKTFITWDEMVEIILYMQEHGITIEKKMMEKLTNDD